MTVQPVLDIDLMKFTKPGDKVPNYAAVTRKLSAFDLPAGTAVRIHVYGYPVFPEALDWLRPDLHIQPCSADFSVVMEWTREIYRMQRGGQ